MTRLLLNVFFTFRIKFFKLCVLRVFWALQLRPLAARVEIYLFTHLTWEPFKLRFEILPRGVMNAAEHHQALRGSIVSAGAGR